MLYHERCARQLRDHVCNDQPADGPLRYGMGGFVGTALLEAHGAPYLYQHDEIWDLLLAENFARIGHVTVTDRSSISPSVMAWCRAGRSCSLLGASAGFQQRCCFVSLPTRPRFVHLPQPHHWYGCNPLHESPSGNLQTIINVNALGRVHSTRPVGHYRCRDLRQS